MDNSNPYDDVVQKSYAPVPAQDNNVAPQEATPVPEQNPYDDVAQQLHDPNVQETALRSSLLQGMQSNPDAAAKAAPLADANQIPLDMAQRNYEKLAKNYDFDQVDFKQLLTEYPKLSTFLSQPDNAAVAHDDIPALKKISDFTDKLIGDATDMDKSRDLLAAGIRGFISSPLKGLGEGGMRIGENIYNSGELVKQTTGDPVSSFIMKGVGGVVGLGGELAQTVGEGYDALADKIDTGDKGFMPSLIRAVGMIGGTTAAAGLTGGASLEPSLIGMGADAGAEQAKAAGLYGTPRGDAAMALNAALMGVFGRLSMSAAIKGLPDAWRAAVTNSVASTAFRVGLKPNGAAAQVMGKVVNLGYVGLTDAMSMMAQAAGGNIISNEALGTKKPLSEGVADQGLVMGLAGMISHVLIGATSDMGGAADKEQAQARADAMAEGRKIMAESKTMGRSPQTVNKLLDGALGGQSLFFNPGALNTFYQKLPPDAQQKLSEMMPDLKDDLADSTRTGDDVQMKAADYHTYIQPIAGSEALDGWAKFRAEQPSVGDLKDHEEMMQRLTEEADKEGYEPGSSDDVGDKVYQGLVNKYGKTGPSGIPEIARLLSTNPAKAHQVLSEKYKDNPAALDLIDKMIGNINFVREYPALKEQFKKGDFDLFLDKARNGVTQGEETLNQLGKDGKKVKASPTKRPPILDFIARNVDLYKGSGDAGEFKHLGITPQTHRYLFKDKPTKLGMFSADEEAPATRGLDNVPVSEFNNAMKDYGISAPSEDGTYVDKQWLMDQVGLEAHGKGQETDEQAQHDRATEDLHNVLDHYAMDIKKASNDQIKKAINDYAAEYGLGKTFHQRGDATKTPAFKKWFSDSKVVDENGDPLIVYHATNAKEDFDTFDTTISEMGSHFGTSEQAAQIVETATSFRGQKPRTYPVYLSIKNPIRLVDQGDFSPGIIAGQIEQQGIKIYGADNEGGPEREDIVFALEEAGYDGIVYLNRREGVSGESHDYDGYPDDDFKINFPDAKDSWIALHPAQIKSIHNDGNFSIRDENILHQGGEENPRGSVTFAPDHAVTMRLFSGENLSTVLHELGHIYFHTLSELSKLEGALPEHIQDVRTMRDYVGAKGDEALSVDQEEKIADAFLTYLRQGEAPSAEMRSPFDRFKGWLTRLYSGVRDTLPAITPEVKDVFDRLLATSDEIDKMKNNPEFSPEPQVINNLNKAEAARYIKKYKRMVSEAKDRLFREAMRQSEKLNTAKYKEARAHLRGRFDELASQEQRYQAADAVVEQGGMSAKTLAKDFGPEVLKYLSGHGGLVAKKGGIEPGEVSALMGYGNSRQMIEDFMNMDPKKVYVDKLTDDEMVARHGDMLKDGTIEREAVAAFHNNLRAEIIGWEMHEYAKLADMPAPSKEAVKAKAFDIITNRKIKDVTPRRFYTAEVRAAMNAGKALGKKDFVAAATAKAQQLLNHHLYKLATDAKENYEKTVDKWTDTLLRKKDDKLSKSMDVDFANAARLILAQHGFGNKPSIDLNTWETRLAADNPELYQDIHDRVSSALMSDAKPLSQMSVGEFQGLADTVNSILHLGREEKSIRIEGQRLDRREVVQGIVDSLADVKSADLTDTTVQRATGKDQIKKDLMGAQNWLKRVEPWILRMDGGRYDGPMRKMFFEPVRKAVDAYEEAKKSSLANVYETIAPHKDDLLGEPIPAPELVIHDAQGNPQEGKFYTFQNKGELIGMMMHLGNGYEAGSNGYKLLRGNAWDHEGFDSFMARAHRDGIIKKEDWDLVQKLWNMTEAMKPDVWRAHKEMYDYYPTEITKVPVQTPFGEYEGGYWPAIADRMKNTDVADRYAKDAITTSNEFAFPTTGRGATKERSAQYAAPLEMSLELLPAHMDWALRFIHLEPPIKQATKIMFDKQFKAEMDRIDPTAIRSMLVPWMQRTARQVMDLERGERLRTFDSVLRFFKVGMQMKTLGFNFIYPFQRIGEVAPIIQNSDTGSTLEAFGELVRDNESTRESIRQQSVFMRNRHNFFDENYEKQISDMLKDRSVFKKVGDWSLANAYITERWTHRWLDDIQWLSSYKFAAAGKAEGVDATDDKAVTDYADSMVRHTQGSFQTVDMSRIESGSMLKRLWTVFYGIMNTKANMLVTNAKLIAGKDTSIPAKSFAMLGLYINAFAIPMFVAELFKEWFHGGPHEKGTGTDASLKAYAELFAASQARGAAGLAPGGGLIASPLINKIEGNKYDDTISFSPAALNWFEDQVKVPETLYAAMFKHGSKTRAMNAILNAAGEDLLLPLTPVKRAVDYAIAVNEHKENPKNPWDYARGILGGPSVPK